MWGGFFVQSIMHHVFGLRSNNFSCFSVSDVFYADKDLHAVVKIVVIISLRLNWQFASHSSSQSVTNCGVDGLVEPKLLL